MPNTITKFNTTVGFDAAPLKALIEQINKSTTALTAGDLDMGYPAMEFYREHDNIRYSIDVVITTGMKDLGTELVDIVSKGEPTHIGIDNIGFVAKHKAKRMKDAGVKVVQVYLIDNIHQLKNEMVEDFKRVLASAMHFIDSEEIAAVVDDINAQVFPNTLEASVELAQSTKSVMVNHFIVRGENPVVKGAFELRKGFSLRAPIDNKICKALEPRGAHRKSWVITDMLGLNNQDMISETNDDLQQGTAVGIFSFAAMFAAFIGTQDGNPNTTEEEKEATTYSLAGNPTDNGFVGVPLLQLLYVDSVYQGSGGVPGKYNTEADSRLIVAMEALSGIKFNEWYANVYVPASGMTHNELQADPATAQQAFRSVTAIPAWATNVNIGDSSERIDSFCMDDADSIRKSVKLKITNNAVENVRARSTYYNGAIENGFAVNILSGGDVASSAAQVATFLSNQYKINRFKNYSIRAEFTSAFIAYVSTVYDKVVDIGNTDNARVASIISAGRHFSVKEEFSKTYGGVAAARSVRAKEPSFKQRNTVPNQGGMSFK